MLINRVLPVARRLSSIHRGVTPLVCVRMSHYDKPPADYVYPTFDEVPGPCGDWQQHYDQNQRKYNLVLLVGVGVFAITVAVAYSSGLFWCNFFPPEKPAPKVPCSK